MKNYHGFTCCYVCTAQYISHNLFKTYGTDDAITPIKIRALKSNFSEFIPALRAILIHSSVSSPCCEKNPVTLECVINSETGISIPYTYVDKDCVELRRNLHIFRVLLCSFVRLCISDGIMVAKWYYVQYNFTQCSHAHERGLRSSINWRVLLDTVKHGTSYFPSNKTYNENTTQPVPE